MTPIQGNSLPVTRKRTKWRSFQESLTEAKLKRIQEAWAGRWFSDSWETSPQRMGEPWVVRCVPVTKVWEGMFMLALSLRQRHKGSWKVVLWTIRKDFLHLSRGSPKCWNFHGKSLHSCLGMGDINHDICLIKNNLLHCLQMPRIIHRTNTIFLLSTKGQRHSWLIQRCFSKINASFRAVRELAGQNSSEGNSSRADDLRAKGREGTVTRGRAGAAERRGPGDQEGVICACLPYSSYPVGLQSFLVIPAFLILPGPTLTSSHSGNLATTQVYNALSFTRLF